MANQLTAPSQDSVWIGKQSATVESKVHMGFVGHDVAKPVLQRLAGEREPNRHCVSFGDGFNRVGRFFQNYFAKRQEQIRYVRIVGGQIAQQLAIRWPSHFSAG